MKVYILLTNTGTLFTNMIKSYTKKPYNHASISFDLELTEVYSFGRKTARNPFIGGFVKEDMKNDLFKQADCAIYSLSLSEMQYNRMRNYIQWMELQKDMYRYNFIGLFGFILKKPIKREKAFFCSQFVANVLHKCNIIHFDKPTSLIAPYDFQSLDQFQLEYEGKLHDYLSTNVDEKLGSYTRSMGNVSYSS